MITHVVLFRPRCDLAPQARQELIAAFEDALKRIPFIRRWRLGRRAVLGHAYEARMQADYPYVAMLEFESAAELGAYLEHPAHEQLAATFYAAVEDALIYDFEIAEGAAGLTPGGTLLGTFGER